MKTKTEKLFYPNTIGSESHCLLTVRKKKNRTTLVICQALPEQGLNMRIMHEEIREILEKRIKENFVFVEYWPENVGSDSEEIAVVTLNTSGRPEKWTPVTWEQLEAITGHSELP